MTKSTEIPLLGTADELSALFSYSKEDSDSTLTSLEDLIAHSFNQTLERDQFSGAWAQVLQNKSNGQYVLKIFCPHHDLSAYEKLIPGFVEAGKLALSIFQSHAGEIQDKNQMRFLFPFGLCMAKTKSVQLLHFPPLETFVYQDYLYSPTNRRWENMMGYNGLTAANFPELETIVDCVPIAAPGDDSKGIAPFNTYFTPYIKKMLQVRLHAGGHQTQPVVAYGEPVRAWVQEAFADQIKAQMGDTPLNVLSLVELKLFDDSNRKTPLLIANHPSKYLYYTDDTDPTHAATKKLIMTQDLIAAGWQVRMAYAHHESAPAVLQELKDHWTNNPLVDSIMAQEDQAYGYAL